MVQKKLVRPLGDLGRCWVRAFGTLGELDLNGRCGTQQGVDLREFLVRIGAAQAIEVLKFQKGTLWGPVFCVLLRVILSIHSSSESCISCILC